MYDVVLVTTALLEATSTARLLDMLEWKGKTFLLLVSIAIHKAYRHGTYTVP
jgi:hypothetical protein